jgi:hypothetical protein
MEGNVCGFGTDFDTGCTCECCSRQLMVPTPSFAFTSRWADASGKHGRVCHFRGLRLGLIKIERVSRL